MDNVELMLVCVGAMLLVDGLLLCWIIKILKARGLASPHVIVSTGNGGVMKGMRLDISGPGYEDDPSLYVRGKCDVIGNVFSHAGGIQQKATIPVLDDGKCQNEAWCPQVQELRSKYMKLKAETEKIDG